MVAATGLNTLVAIVIASPVMALFGYVLQRVVFNRTIPMASAPSASLCSTSAGRSRSRHLRRRNDLRASGTLLSQALGAFRDKMRSLLGR